MSYVIKDSQKKCWYEIDRVVQGMDIITTVEPVYNYKAATQFSTEALADKIIEQITSEGNYSTINMIKENVDELNSLEEQITQQQEAEAIAEAEKLKEEFNESIKKKLEELKKDLSDKGKSAEEIEAAVAAFETVFGK